MYHPFLSFWNFNLTFFIIFYDLEVPIILNGIMSCWPYIKFICWFSALFYISAIFFLIFHLFFLNFMYLYWLVGCCWWYERRCNCWQSAKWIMQEDYGPLRHGTSSNCIFLHLTFFLLLCDTLLCGGSDHYEVTFARNLHLNVQPLKWFVMMSVCQLACCNNV